jgi:hypothetical protein
LPRYVLSFDPEKLTPEILAYTAGLLDGEGSMGIRRNRPQQGRFAPAYTPNVQCKMCDEEPIRFLYEHYGGCFRDKDVVKQSGRTVYQWTLNGWKGGKFLEILLPFLKIPRRIKNAKAAIALMKLQEARGNVGSTPLSPEEREIRDRLYQETLNGGVPTLSL